MLKTQALAFFRRHTDLLLNNELDVLLEMYSLPVSFHFQTGDIVLESYPQVRDFLAQHLTHLRDNDVSALNPNIAEIEVGEKKDRCRVMVIWESVSPKGSLLTRADYFLKDCPKAPQIGMIDFAMPVPPRFQRMLQSETDDA